MRKTKRFRQGVGRLLLLLVAMLAFTSPGRAAEFLSGQRIYFEITGRWTEANAKFAANFNKGNTGSDNERVWLEQVSGTHYWYCDVPGSGYTHVEALRMAPADYPNNIGANAWAWNQIVYTDNSKNLIKLKSTISDATWNNQGATLDNYTSQGGGDETPEFSIIYGTSNNNLPNTLNLSGSGSNSTYTATLPVNNAQIWFKIKAGTDYYNGNCQFTSGYSGPVSISNNGVYNSDLSLAQSGSGSWKFEVTVVNNVPTQVKATWTNGGGDTPVVDSDWYIVYGPADATSISEWTTVGFPKVNDKNWQLDALVVSGGDHFYIKNKVGDLYGASHTFTSGTHDYNVNTGDKRTFPNDSFIFGEDGEHTIKLVYDGNNSIGVWVTAPEYVPEPVDNTKYPAKEAKVRIRGNWAGSDWNSADNANWTTVRSISDGVYFFPLGYWNGTVNFQLEVDGIKYGVNTTVSNRKSHGTGFGDAGGTGTFNFSTGSDHNVYIYIDTDNNKVWYVKNSDPALYVYPRQAREADNNWKAWTKPTVYVTAKYLNANRFAPDWEMEETAEGVYELKNVTLRNIDGGTLTAHILTPTADGNGTYTEATLTVNPSGLADPNNQQVGRSYDLKIANGEFTATAHTIDGKQDLSMPFISFVGAQYVQENYGVTLNSPEKDGFKGTNMGWQEGWVLYDKASPVRDVNGRYIYSTQWPPKSPVYFQGKRTTSEGDVEMGITSDGIVFELASNDYKTGSEWITELTKNDLYKDICGENTTYDGKLNKEPSKWLEPNMPYARYTVENVWVLGATKIWTGWGSQMITDRKTAHWSDHAHWGYGDERTNDTGAEYKTKTAYRMSDQNYDGGKNNGNFMFEQPTYFKSVEFFLPMKETDGVWEVDRSMMYNAVMTATQTIGEAKIEARKKPLKQGETGESNHGQYRPSFNMDGWEGYTIKNIKVTRYFADNEGFDVNDPETWVEASQLAGGTVNSHWDYKKGSDANDGDNTWVTDMWYDAANSQWKWVDDPEALSPGKYFYGMEVEYVSKDGNKEGKVEVPSFSFSIISTEFRPNPVALQLVKVQPRSVIKAMTGCKHDDSHADTAHEVTEHEGGVMAIRNAYNKLTQAERDFLYSHASDDGENGQARYFTYRVNPSGNFYFVEKGKKVTLFTPEEKAIVQKLLSTPEFTPFLQWTSDYWVHIFDAKEYMDKMQANPDIQEFDDLNKIKVSVRKTGDSDWYEFEKGEIVRSGNLFSKIFEGGGSLDYRSFDTKVQYSYVDKDGPVNPNPFTETSSTVRPVLPTAVFESYYYATEPDANKVDWDELRKEYEGKPEYGMINWPDENGMVELKVNSQVPEKKAEFDALPDGDENKGLKFYVPENVAAERNLVTHMRFYRPNVAQDILNKYDFYMSLKVNRWKGGELDKEVISRVYTTSPNEGDPAASDDYLAENGPRFELALENMSPEPGISPEFVINKVWFIEKGVDTPKPLGIDKFTGENYGNKWETSFLCPSFLNNEKALDAELTFGWHYDNTNAGHVNHVLNGLHVKNVYDNLGGSLNEIEGDDDENVGVENKLRPLFYHVESYREGGTHHHYDQVLVYDLTKNWYHGAHPIDGLDAYPAFANGEVIVAPDVEENAKPEGEDDELSKWTIYVSPIYFFVHYPTEEKAMTISGGMELYTGELKDFGIEEGDKPARILVNNPEAVRQIVAVHGGSKEQNLKDFWVATGIDEVLGDGDGEAVYYNMQGLRVANPGNGLYIRVKDGRSEKVML